jgi:hypothetical protein
MVQVPQGNIVTQNKWALRAKYGFLMLPPIEFKDPFACKKHCKAPIPLLFGKLCLNFIFLLSTTWPKQKWDQTTPRSMLSSPLKIV